MEKIERRFNNVVREVLLKFVFSFFFAFNDLIPLLGFFPLLFRCLIGEVKKTLRLPSKMQACCRPENLGGTTYIEGYLQ